MKLTEALKGMEKVAEHINEMQRIHEEYGAIFDHLFRQHQKACKQPIDLSPGNFSIYSFEDESEPEYEFPKKNPTSTVFQAIYSITVASNG